MAKQDIDYGTGANTLDGDELRIAFIKAKENFDELYARVATLETASQDEIVDVHSVVSLYSGDVVKTLTVFKGGFFTLKIRFKQRATTDQYLVNCFAELSAGVVVSQNLSDLMVYKEVGSYSKGTWTFNKFYADAISRSSNEDLQGQTVGEGITEDVNYDDSTNYYKQVGVSQIDIASGAVNWAYDNSVSSSVTGTIREIVLTGHLLGATLA